MKLTKSRLEQIIKEELSSVLIENEDPILKEDRGYDWANPSEVKRHYQLIYDQITEDLDPEDERDYIPKEEITSKQFQSAAGHPRWSLGPGEGEHLIVMANTDNHWIDFQEYVAEVEEIVKGNLASIKQGQYPRGLGK